MPSCKQAALNTGLPDTTKRPGQTAVKQRVDSRGYDATAGTQLNECTPLSLEGANLRKYLSCDTPLQNNEPTGLAGFKTLYTNVLTQIVPESSSRSCSTSDASESHYSVIKSDSTNATSINICSYLPIVQPLSAYTPPPFPILSIALEDLQPLAPQSLKPLTLPTTRGVFLRGIPPFLTISEILANVRGGPIERVDFHPSEHRTGVAVYFFSPASAHSYRAFCTLHGGVYWAGVGYASPVDFIPKSKGGHEPVRPNVAEDTVREGATRCLKISRLPNGADVRKIIERVKRQSRTLEVEFEAIYFGEHEETGGMGSVWEVLEQARKRRTGSRTVATLPSTTVVLKMASVGTALGAKCQLKKSPFYRGVLYEFLPDDCAGELEMLAEKWRREQRFDGQRIAVSG